MGPDELDDLLASIRAEGKKESALALYEGIREDDLVDENIDERILKLLGLNDVFDIDYGTYITLLKERLTASRNFSKKLSTEEDELLVSEFKKVKGKVGRFRIKRKKITAENLGVTGPVKVSTEKFYLTSKAIIPQPALPAGEDSENIKDISKKLDELIKSILEQDKEAKKRAERERKEKEDKKRRKRESDLEKVTKPAQELLKKVVAPFQSILDRIMKFIKFTLLGFAFDKFVKWFSDPKNKKKIQVLTRFLKDWWPSLATAAALFLTPFGKFIRKTLKLLGFFSKALVSFMVRNPAAAAALATGVSILVIKDAIDKERKDFENAERGNRYVPPTSQPNKSAGSSGGAPIPAQRNGGIVPRLLKIPFFNQSINAKDIALNGGAYIDENTGLNITGAGPDTQLVAAQPGEIMMSKKAVDKHGADFFLRLNKDAGGTNVPRMVNNIQLAAGGGMIGGFGRVMAPRTGGQNRFASQGARSVFQMFGLNVPGTEKPTTYSGSDISRYNRLNPTRNIQMGQGYESLSGGGYGLSPTIMTVLKKTASRGGSFVGNAFRNFGQNVKTIKNATRRQEIIMRQQGVTPDGYVNLRGQPINLGPQSRAMPVGTPTIVSRTQTIVLPPIARTVEKKPKMVVKPGTQIPDFQTTVNTPYRSVVANALGISDLIGA